jgi:hypothetical protein
MNQKSMLVEGLSDAVGFVGGALIGFWAGHLLGLDIFEAGYGNGAIAGIVLVGLGGWAAAWRARRKKADWACRWPDAGGTGKNPKESRRRCRRQIEHGRLSNP